MSSFVIEDCCTAIQFFKNSHNNNCNWTCNGSYLNHCVGRRGFHPTNCNGELLVEDALIRFRKCMHHTECRIIRCPYCNTSNRRFMEKFHEDCWNSCLLCINDAMALISTIRQNKLNWLCSIVVLSYTTDNIKYFIEFINKILFLEYFF